MAPAIRGSARIGEDERRFMPNGKMNCFADTNLIVYAIDPAEIERRTYVRDFLTRVITDHTFILSPQSLNECYRVVTEKRKAMPRSDAQRLVAALRKYSTAPYDFQVTQQAWQIQDRYGYGWWDSMLLASASLARCNVFLSEDMQHEQEINGLRIVSPFEVDPAIFLSR
jgi:predicted nucleic acid-binding protein